MQGYWLEVDGTYSCHWFLDAYCRELGDAEVIEYQEDEQLCWFTSHGAKQRDSRKYKTSYAEPLGYFLHRDSIGDTEDTQTDCLIFLITIKTSAGTWPQLRMPLTKGNNHSDYFYWNHVITIFC
jgi:hypothetical protein